MNNDLSRTWFELEKKVNIKLQRAAKKGCPVAIRLSHANLAHLSAGPKDYQASPKRYWWYESGAEYHPNEALSACSVGSLVLTSSTVGSALTGTGVKAILPLGFLACLNATIVMDLTLISRHVTKKKKKHHDTLRLVQSKKSLVEQCVSSVLADDEQIDNAEFGKVVTCLKNYYDHKDQLQQPMSNFSEDLSECFF
ncbi:unnamed protein product [Mytilus edulis]|uniref:Uncharacterized protein n=1 Tax=Mytilus edulis TaxID=6550 RepID=A0A8S3SXS4_MYTED|nr:unnamed protein product [Mytilus edulis]